MAGGSKAKMSAALLYIVFVSLTIFSVVVSVPDDLPKEDECGTLNPVYYTNQKRISEIDEFPWMGRIRYINTEDDTYWYKCYTILISKRFTLSRANCFDFEEEAVSVKLGDWNLANSKLISDCDNNGRCAPVPREYDIEEVIIHHSYRAKTSTNAIALVKLMKPVTYSDFIQPICLPNKDVVHMNFANQHLQVTGWYFNSSTGETLAKSFARVVSLKTCEEKMRHFTVDKNTNICAYTCWDDYIYSLGSALMDVTIIDNELGYYYLVGLNLHGLEVCSLLYPDVYIRIDRYLDWIYENIQ